MSNVPVALQLYTVRDQTADDFCGTVKKVAEMGYTGVEFAGYGGLSAQQMVDLLGETGLKPAGSHIGLNLFQESLADIIDYTLAIGGEYVGVPALPGELRNPAGFRQTAKLMNEWGAVLKDAGLVLYYHNHAFEFEVMEGVRGMDILWNETDPELVKYEIDCYWAVYANEDPAALIKAHAGRYPLIHLKDMVGTGDARTFAEVGEGTIPWQPVFEASEAQSAIWYIVEQDRCARPSLESAALSVKNLTSWGKG